MASSPPVSPLAERQEDQGGAEREATEMEHYNQVLSRSSVDINSSAQQPHADNATPNGAYFSSTRRPLAKLWQRQVSVTVPHDACRDHYGTPTFPFPRQVAQGCGRFGVYFS